jgi:phage FluMu protein Com
MAIFEWVCTECNIFWDRDCSLGNAPARTKCPKCKKLSDRYWQNANVGISFKDDGTGNQNNPGVQDFHTVRRRYQKHFEHGYDKQSANKFLHKSIKQTKNAMDNEEFRYKSANVDWSKFAESRGLRKVSEKEAKDKQERSRVLTGEAYDRANKMGYKDIGSNKLDIAKPNKNKPT